MSTSLESPEENFREVITSNEASAFLMDRDTVLTATANTSIAEPHVDKRHNGVEPVPLRSFSPNQLAERWGVTAESVRFMIHTGRLNGFRIGKRALRVREDAVEAFETHGTEGKVYKPEKAKPTMSEQIGWSIRVASMKGSKRPK